MQTKNISTGRVIQLQYHGVMGVCFDIDKAMTKGMGVIIIVYSNSRPVLCLNAYVGEICIGENIEVQTEHNLPGL